MRNDNPLAWFLMRLCLIGMGIALVGMLASCALWQLGTPPGHGVTPRPCDGRFVYPDSAGVCVPKDETR